MLARLPLFAQRATRAAIVSVAALSLWSCTTAGNDVASGVPNYNPATNTETTAVTENQTVQGNAEPQQVPPTDDAVAAAVPTPTSGDAPALVDDAEAVAAAGPAEPTEESQAETPSEGNATVAADQSPTVDPAAAGDGSVATAAPAEAAPPPKKTGLLAFFGSKPRTATSAANRDGGGAPPAPTPAKRAAVAKAPGQVAINATAGASAEFNMAALDIPSDNPMMASRPSSQSDDGGLPGVRQSALFEIKRRSGMDDDSDVDLYEDAPTVQLASVGGMGRGAHGLLTQHSSVDVQCLKPALVRILKQIEAKYGRKLVVTSGYRSPSHNRRARGAKNSQHMYCAAADIQVPGVGKAELARYIRAMPGRGGVGTYCHTNSIHVDVGPNRDWNWRCRGRRKG